MKNLLLEINHPAHIHLFRNLSRLLLEKGLPSLFMVKSDPLTERLSSHYDLVTMPMGKKGSGMLQKYLFQLRFLWKSVMLTRSLKANIGMGVSMNLPMVSKFTSMHSLCLDDDDMSITPVFAKHANKANVILTPEALAHENRGPHHIVYPGYHELAYLHPMRFVQDPSVLELLGVNPDETWFVVRFNAFKAHHDSGEGGMTFEQKKRVVEKLMDSGKVFISSESEIDPEFRELHLPERPELMHSILYFASMYIGESQTMTSEAAVLGTPALKCNTFAGRLSVPNELEKKYGLCYSYLPEDFHQMLKKIDGLLKMKNLKQEWQFRRQKMLNDKIDVTAFLVWFVEHYPESVAIMKSDPEFIKRFK